jgi:hypothetical protein
MRVCERKLSPKLSKSACTNIFSLSVKTKIGMINAILWFHFILFFYV